jgi:hypothetical protein
LSVTITSGAKPCFLSSLRISFTVAVLLRRRSTEQVENLGFAVQPRATAKTAGPQSSRHLVEMTFRRWPRASTAKFSSEQWPELQDPPSHRFVGHVEPTLSEQIFDVPIAERETHIELNGLPDDRRRKLVAGKRDRHQPSSPLAFGTLSGKYAGGRRPSHTRLTLYPQYTRYSGGRARRPMDAYVAETADANSLRDC